MPRVLGSPAGLAGVVAVLSVLMAVLLAVLGAYGTWSVAAEGRQVAGRVVAAVSCADAGRAEEVEFELDGAVRRAALDACGHREGEQVVLTVTDDGPGIAEADRARVFERFTRLDEARRRDDAGAGLGLAIVERIVARHGGTVAVTDRLDGAPGARFVVRLPVA